MVGNQFDQYCDTDLCLTPGGRRTVLQNPHDGSSPSAGRVEEGAAKATHEQQQITIFYGSRVCVCDVTELQARAIICMANQEATESCNTTKEHVDVDHGNPHRRRRRRRRRRLQHQQQQQEAAVVVSHPASLWSTPSASVQPHLANPAAAAGLSMTRSLQRFLHNRKARAVDQSSNFRSHGHGHGQAPPMT